MMPLQARFSFIFSAVLAVGVCAGTSVQAQDADAQNQAGQPASQSSSQTPADSQSSTSQTSFGVYVPLDPLAKVRYDNRWDLSLGFAYDHMKAGPDLLEGSNLGGLDMNGSYWLNRHWAVEASGRGYVGTSGAHVNYLPPPHSGTLKGPMVKQYFFVAGPEWLGPHNKHGAILAHVMFGGVYGNFEKDLLGIPPGWFHFYYNQVAPAAIVGGHFDLNRSEHWVFRVTPDAVMTHYQFTADPPMTYNSYSQFDVNFAISVGVEYKFTKIKRSSKTANWVSGW